MSDPSRDSGWSFRTRAIHVGNEIDPATGAVVPPIHLASTYRQPGAGKWAEFDYGRSGNPTRSQLQETLASLEGGCGALAFASGMSAIHGVTLLLSKATMSSPAVTSTAAPTDCCTRYATAAASTSRWST